MTGCPAIDATGCFCLSSTGCLQFACAGCPTCPAAPWGGASELTIDLADGTLDGNGCIECYDTALASTVWRKLAGVTLADPWPNLVRTGSCTWSAVIGTCHIETWDGEGCTGTKVDDASMDLIAELSCDDSCGAPFWNLVIYPGLGLVNRSICFFGDVTDGDTADPTTFTQNDYNACDTGTRWTDAGTCNTNVASYYGSAALTVTIGTP